MRRFAHCLTASLLLTSPLLAHPGHGVTEGNSVVHYLVEPTHIGSVLLVVAGISAILLVNRRKLQRERARKH